VACGERATGVTLMRVVRKLDAGPVADAERVLIEPLDTTVEIERKLSVACVPLVARALPRLAGGELEFKAQDETVATYCRRLNKDDGRLDFAASAAALAARINGLHPWPGCTVEINGTPVKLGLADAVAEVGDPGYNTAKPGTVIGSDSEGLLVATGGGVLRLRRLQRPGGRMLTAPEFLRGFPVAVGTVLSSRPMSKLVGDRPLR
jgi:methionyl-tRNA formyltransferase